MYEVAARGLQTKTATIRVRFVPTRFFMSKPASVNFIYALSTLNGTSVFAAQVVLSLYALKLGASPFAVGLLAATFSLFPMLLAMTAGVAGGVVEHLDGVDYWRRNLTPVGV